LTLTQDWLSVAGSNKPSASMMGLKYCNGLTADLASKNSISFATHQTVGKQITLAKVQSAPEERGCILRQFRTIQFLG
jgi:hypothetical protein